MKNKIKSISFENFKLFSEEKNIKMPTDSLFILDGPNGYGKTTIFDAIEILIKGERNREESLDTTYKVRNKTLPFVNDRTKKIVIKGIFEIKGEEHCYLREFEKESTKGVSQNIKKASVLYKISDGERKEIDDEIMYQELGLNSDGSNFNLLHYVQQEESTAFLKHSEKGRMDEIGKLFNTSESDYEFNKIDKVRRQLIKVKKQITEQLDQSEKLKNSYTVEKEDKKMEPEAYLQLFNRLKIPWDNEEYFFEEYKHVQEVTTQLEELKELVIYKNEFGIYQKNKKIMNLANQDSLLKLVLISPDTLKKEEQIKILAKNVIDNQKWLQQTDDQKINWLLEDRYVYAFDYLESSQEMFKELHAAILKDNKNINDSEKLLMNIQQAREKLHEKHQQFIEEANGNDILCPYCGEAYSIESLENAYQLAKEFCKGNNELADNVLEMEKQRDEQIIELTTAMENFNKINQGNLILFEWIIAGEGVKDKLEKSKIYLEKEKIIYSDYLVDGHTIVTDGQKNLALLKNKIQELKVNLSTEMEEKMEKRKQLFLDFLKQDEEQLNELTVESIESKRIYIENSYYDYEKSKRDKEIEKYKKLDAKNQDLGKLKEKIDEIHSIYTKQKKNYLENLLSNLEITLYIYTGKIIQNYPGGLGIFMKIESEGSYLKFLSDYQDDVDIFAKLSTGQLSAFVISLVLAMNRKFSTEELPLLLIDDPVQSMDELNVSAFVDLLRNEFSDHQIIVSTHEERISNFFKYKYKMSNLDARSLNVRKELNFK
ncbi:AAA family ATPase [Carnobacterium gallinarum]|uniref:AAA family ATPase n=1 Tax=Carnobacterium gallinarum TaxID=2749 RepID=UPI00054EEB24|nr:AAA family ATPase [Carnobacterium gallinarum]